MSTAAESYPYSKAAIIPPPPVVPAPEATKAGKGLMQYIPQRILSAEKQALIARFGKRHPQRILPGSVLTITAKHAPTSFTGVLLAIRRRGADTSVILRNVLNRTGVEAQFFLGSPHVTGVRVLLNAGGPGKEGHRGRRMRRAKLYYLRDSPEKMSAIGQGMRG